MKRFIAPAVAALALTAGPGLAYADSRCSNFEIVVDNEFIGADGIGNEIKVFDLEYFDREDNRWRDETTDNETINYKGSNTWSKNLSFVGGESGVKIKVHYRVFWGGSWGADRSVVSSPFQCIDNGAIHITVD